MKVIAIGATGYVGSCIVHLLIEQGHEVAVFHRGKTTSDLPDEVCHVHGNRNVLSDLRSALKQFGSEVVLDVIPYTEQQAQALVKAARGLASRVVALSSGDVYRNYDGFGGHATAPPDPVPLCEDAPLRETGYSYRGQGLPIKWADDYDKILVECIVLGEPELPGTILRLPAMYGSGDKQHRLRPYLQRFDDHRPAVLLAEDHASWLWTRGYVENVAAAIALAITDSRASGRIYNVGENPTPTEREWVKQIGAVAGWQGKVIALPKESLPGHLHQPFDFRYDLATETERIRQELDYTEPIGQQESLEKTIEWERSHLEAFDQPDYAAEDEAITAHNRTV